MNERRTHRAEVYERLAAIHRAKADQRYDAQKAIGDMIPMGQPILVGHHSERSHRADLKRRDGHMRKMSEHLDKAKYYDSMAAKMRDDKEIFIDDPDALERTEDRLKACEALREAYKSFNKTWKAKGLKAAIDAWPGSKDRIMRIVQVHYVPEEYDRTGKLPSYLLANLGSTINRLRTKVDTLATAKTLDNEILFETSTGRAVFEGNRLNVYFNEVPSVETRSKLKRTPLALKWSPMSKAWTRQVNAFVQSESYKKYLLEAINGQ